MQTFHPHFGGETSGEETSGEETSWGRNVCHPAKLTSLGRSFGKNVHHRLPDVWTFKPGFYPAQAGKLEGNKSGKTSPCP
ncbi:hypothetical protein DPMN_121816 [Dreissena polymorpha]|uniref:Uncharacterized protein n=1 Tax=Dreissena polymorpha TaxID=45954 RepID=A0A9D4JTW8_DREPO|nr:hypothetical protein DPMN_121816 [Dreissena polymorpha]